VTTLDAKKIEQQTEDGVIMMTLNVEPFPLLHCVLPAKQVTSKLEAVAAPALRNQPFPVLLRMFVGELTAANQQQDQQVIIETANLIGLYAMLRHPIFGPDLRLLLTEVRSNRHNLGLLIAREGNQFAFGVTTGLDNIARRMIGKPQEQQKYPAPEAPASEWRTRVDPELTKQFALDEMHMAVFQPLKGKRGLSHVVGIMIPETPETEITLALKIAAKADARVTIQCDTAEQAEAMAEYVAPLLPQHSRIAYERAEAGKWGALV